jgi:hypothetical protein
MGLTQARLSNVVDRIVRGLKSRVTIFLSGIATNVDRRGVIRIQKPSLRCISPLGKSTVELNTPEVAGPTGGTPSTTAGTAGSGGYAEIDSGS